MVILAGASLDLGDLVEDLVERRRHQLVHLLGVGSLDEPRRVAVALEQGAELLGLDPGQHGRVGDLVPVQVQDRQHRAVACRVQELVRMPARRERAGLGLAVADHAQREQVRVVEHRSIRVQQRVAELAALVDRAGRLGRDVARDPARERELAEQPPQPLLVAGDVRIDLAVGAVEIGARHQAGSAVARAGDVDRAQLARPDRPVHVGVDEVEPRGRAPMSEQPRLDVLGPERLAQQRVVEQIDLPDRQIVRGAPPGVDRFELHCGQRPLARMGLDGHERGLQDLVSEDAAASVVIHKPASTRTDDAEIRRP